MRVISLVLALTALGPSSARAYVAIEPLRRVIRGAFPDLRACVRRRVVEEGRYVVRFEVAATGRVSSFEIVEAPSSPSPDAARCIEAAFTRLRFPSYDPPPRPSPPARSGNGRQSRVPPDLRRRRRAGPFVISYPFVLRR